MYVCTPTAHACYIIELINVKFINARSATIILFDQLMIFIILYDITSSIANSIDEITHITMLIYIIFLFSTSFIGLDGSGGPSGIVWCCGKS